MYNFAMNLTVSASSSESRPTDVTSAPMDCYQDNRLYTTRHSWSKDSKPKTSYQLAHPAIHARHKWLKLRPRTLLQLQQVSQTRRPLPLLDVLPSTAFIPLLSRHFPQIFRRWNGLGPNDLVIVRSELCERVVSDLSEKSRRSGNKVGDQREVIATIRQPLQKEARLQGKAKIFLTLGSVCEATPLASRSYEFLVETENGVRVMRWALRRSKRRWMSTSGTHQREESKRFTFSIIDPTSRRHPVIASMTRNHLEVYHEYSPGHRSCARSAIPTSGMSEFSDKSEMGALDSPTVIVDDRLRTLITVTGIWVAFREGWSHIFTYRDPVAISHAKMLASPITSIYQPSATTIDENNTVVSEGDAASRYRDFGNFGRRCSSVIWRVRRSKMISPLKWSKSVNGLAKRSNSTRTI